MADPRSISRDEKRITTKGRIGIRYNALFGKKLNNEVEVTGYGTIKFFHRTASDYRIINRYGIGLSGKYINRSIIAKKQNELVVGGDLFSQPARTEYYKNINGAKGDLIEQLVSENIVNKGLYFSDSYDILREKLSVLLTGRYDNVSYQQATETKPVLNDHVTFDAFTPKLALNYKFTRLMALYGSFGLSFDSPANNELDSPDPNNYLFNHDLKPQQSQNFELGVKGNVFRWDKFWMKRVIFETTLFYIIIDNEIIPYEVNKDVYYRNAGRTNRGGVEIGGQVEIIPDLNFSVTYTYSNFTYKSYIAKSLEIDSTGTLIETDRDFSGNRVPSVPKNNLYIALAYSRSVGRHFNIFARTSYQGIGGMWVDDANSDETNGYNLFNVLAGMDLKFGKFNIMLSGGVNNLFDEVYVGFTNTNSANLRFYEAGAPRDWNCSINVGYTF
jgi:iron complex outermembrane receptor protein